MLTPAAAVEALLFAAGEPLEKKRLANLLGINESDIQPILEELAEALQGRGIALIETDSLVELRTSPEAAEIVKKFRDSEFTRDLGTASLETLAVVAYQNGTTRSEIDWVRGVNSSASLRTLLLRGLIEGKEDAVDKRRTRYTLTPDAFAHLGITKLSELPRAAELSAAAAAIIATEGSPASESQA
ncbi:MAG: SMC-Scp complex subunit ScpB [bacterium]|nr:SMC-Scp complex subunit ScpB [bacterium]